MVPRRLTIFLFSASLAFLAAGTAFAAPTGAAPPSAGTDDLLRSLPSPLRENILRGAGAEEICHYRVLEKEMKISFRGGSPASDPGATPRDFSCSDGTSPAVALIEKPEDLKAKERRMEWFWSATSLCAYKKQLAAALGRAARKLKANPGYKFVAYEDIQTNQLCHLSPGFGSTWEKVKGSYCSVSKGDSASSMECFYKQDCRMECGAGATNLQNLGAYELFAGADGVMDDAEAARFNRAYPSVSIGPFAQNAEQGIVGTSNPFEGKNAEKKMTSLSKNSYFGAYGLTGFRIALSTAEGYQENAIRGLETGTHDLTDLSELTSNAIVISTSPEAARQFASTSTPGREIDEDDQFMAQMELDSKALTQNLKALTYLAPNQTEAVKNPDNWLPYEQIVATKNAKAVIAGTYALRNATPADRQAYANIQAILSRPMYRDTKIYIHPHGEMTLAEAILDKKKFHYDAPFTLVSKPSAEDGAMGKFLKSRVDACLGR